MNKVELEKEAEEYARKYINHKMAVHDIFELEVVQKDVTQAYIVGYEARNGEVKILKEKIHWWKKEVNVAHRAREDEFEKLVIENKALKRNFDESKEIIKTFLGLMQTFGYSPSINNFITKAEQFIEEK